MVWYLSLLIPVLEELWNHRRYRTMKYLKSISKYFFFQINRIWEKTLKEPAEYILFKKTIHRYYTALRHL